MTDYGTSYNGDECPFCWDTGTIMVEEMDDNGDTRAVPRPCPEGCPSPDEVLS